MAQSWQKDELVPTQSSSRIYKVEDTARKALDIGLQNANDIKKMDENQDRVWEEISTTLKAEIKKELDITKLQVQMKATHIEVEVLRNSMMRSTLIFKNIPGDFITCELDLSYSFEEVDFQISQAHQNNEHNKDPPNKNQQGLN